jgi:hypothetical protein
VAGLGRGLADWLSGRRRRSLVVPTPAEAADPWAGPSSPAPPDPVSRLLSDIEATALAIYEAHDAPTRPGQYVRSPKTRRWRFLADRLGAEERWAMVLANPPEDGWRYGALEDIGADPAEPPELRAASALLRGCRQLRTSLRTRDLTTQADDIEAALRLGADWRMLKQALGQREAEPLKLTAPRKPRAPRRKT